MKALKFLIPSLFAASMVAVPLAASAAEDTQASRSTFRSTALKSPYKAREHSLKERGAKFEAFAPQEFGTSSLHGETGREVPELSGSAAGASLALVGAGLLALTGRRKRKAPAQ